MPAVAKTDSLKLYFCYHTMSMAMQKILKRKVDLYFRDFSALTEMQDQGKTHVLDYVQTLLIKHKYINYL